MSDQAVANRYASALFELAKEQGQIQKVNEELQAVKEVIEKTPEFIQFLVHPKVTKEQKQTFIEQNFGRVISKTSLHGFLILVDRNRTESLVPMIKKFKELAYAAQNMAEAQVYSAKPLTEKEQEEIAKTFAKKTNKTKLEVSNIVDSDLIGGIKIRIGDRIYDGTVKAQLDRIKRSLVAGTR
jgi:F-type H+-transporting ATPase subunit delta